MSTNEESYANGWAAHMERPDSSYRNPYDRELQYLSHYNFRNGWHARHTAVGRGDPIVARLDVQIIELASSNVPNGIPSRGVAAE